MADFDDMTGWREELHAYWKTEEFKQIRQEEFRKTIENPGPPPKQSLTSVYEFMRLLLNNSNCVAAMNDLQDWFEENPDIYPDDDRENYPGDAAELLADFRAWYRYKKGTSTYLRALDVAGHAAARVLRGKLPSVDSPETEAFLREFGTDKIDFQK